MKHFIKSTFFLLVAIYFFASTTTVQAHRQENAMMLIRYMADLRGADLTRLQVNTSPEIVKANIQSAINNASLDVDENGSINQKDAIMILRYISNIRGAELTKLQSNASPEKVEANIVALTTSFLNHH